MVLTRAFFIIWSVVLTSPVTPKITMKNLPLWNYPNEIIPWWIYHTMKLPNDEITYDVITARWNYPRWNYRQWIYRTMKLPHDEITHDEISADEFTARWIYRTTKLPRWNYLTMNLPYDEIIHDEITDNEFPARWNYRMMKFPQWNFCRWIYHVSWENCQHLCYETSDFNGDNYQVNSNYFQREIDTYWSRVLNTDLG